MGQEPAAPVDRYRRMIEDHYDVLRRRYHVASLGIFGSYVREEQTPSSDLDVLVTFTETPSLLQFVALEDCLTELLGVQVDLVMRDALKPHLGQRILEEVVPV